MSYKCEYCDRYFSTRNAYSQHVNRCIHHIELNTEESINDISDMASSINEMSLDSIEEFQNIQEENLSPLSEGFYHYENYESDSNYAGDISFGGMSQISNIPEEYENFDNILPESLQSYEEEPEIENIKEFPSEAYADLMKLVIENNLSNKAGNAIIKFFNKHSNLSQSSPLPKNIDAGRKFMERMNISQLSYSKHCILTYNSQEYFIYYRPIKNCIENLLSIPEISQNFMLRYEDLEVKCIHKFLILYQ
jgi:hypothetical protein